MSMRVFIIDDDRDHAESVADVLAMRGFECELAFSGEAGLARFRESSFDIVFMDVKLPGMNGVETFFEFRKLRPGVKVMLMTGFSLEQLVAQAVENGALGVLRKPFAMQELLDVLEQVKPRGMVLVADDDPEFAASLEPILTHNGYRVKIAKIGDEALTLASHDGLDCLILDVRMPVLGRHRGLSALEARGPLGADDLRHRLPGRAQRGLGAPRPPARSGHPDEAVRSGRASGGARRRDGRPSAAPAHRLSSMAARQKVLIVDDDAEFAESIVDLLLPAGYEPAVADHADDAIQALARFAPAVAMLDVRLGRASGVDLLARFRAERPDLICVLMTAHVDTQSAIAALRQGAYDYFDKSSDPAELLAVLGRCFEKARLQEENRAAYEALRIAKEAAEKANRAKSEFLANISHELRTPLNAIIGFSEVMMQGILGPIANESYRGYLKDIHGSGIDLLNIINDILDLSKAEAGKLELSEQSVDVVAVIDAVARLMATKIDVAGLTLETDLAPGLSFLFCDRLKLKQVLLNLLSNAVKFTPPGGKHRDQRQLRPGRGLRRCHPRYRHRHRRGRSRARAHAVRAGGKLAVALAQRHRARLAADGGDDGAAWRRARADEHARRRHDGDDPLPGRTRRRCRPAQRAGVEAQRRLEQDRFAWKRPFPCEAILLSLKDVRR